MPQIGQVALMAAIVASLLYVPAAVLLLLFSRMTGISLYALMTFGGTLGTALGLFVWWLLAFAGASIYAVLVFPWKEDVPAWPRKN